MKKTKSLIALIFAYLVTSVSVFAQYDISFEIKNCKEDTLLLGYYYLDGTFAIDTATNDKGKFRFKDKKRTLEKGLYFITNNKGRNCEFLISGEQDLKFKTLDSSWPDNLECTNSKNEQTYIEYLKKSNALGKEFHELTRQKNILDTKTYSDKLHQLSSENDKLKEDFIRENPNHLLSKILSAAKPVSVPEFQTIYKADGTIDSVEMRHRGYYWYKNHYFDNIDLNENGLLRTPKAVFYSNFMNYWENVLKYEKADSVLHYADYWINKAQDKKMYNFMVYEITKHYLQDNIMGHDKIYVGMVENYFKSGKYDGLSVSDMEMNIKRADTWSNLLIGKTIPNLACVQDDSNSVWHHLDETKAKYKVLIFWSVECSHCTIEIPQIAEKYDENKQKYNMEIFSVHTEGEVDEMKKFLQEKNIHWINTNGLYANYNWREYFDIEKTPVIYILDSNNKILAKNLSANNLWQVLDILENGGFEL